MVVVEGNSARKCLDECEQDFETCAPHFQNPLRSPGAIRGPRMVVHRILGTLLGLALAGCCEPPTEPCLPWIDPGETYSVELVQHLEFAVPDMPIDPIDGYRGAERSCGQGLDVEVGHQIDVKSLDIDRETSQRCSTNCVEWEAEIRPPGVTRVGSDRRKQLGSTSPALAEIYHADLGNGCTGVYWIGIVSVSETYLGPSAPQYVATDHALFREFVPDEIEPCLRPGSAITMDGWCWDSWAVRITNSDGELITQDIPPPSGD